MWECLHQSRLETIVTGIFKTDSLSFILDLDKIEFLQSHENQEIDQKASHLIEHYFGTKDEDSSITPQVDLSQQQLTSSCSVRLLWKLSSFEAILCFLVPRSDQATQSSPLVEPTVLMELISQVFFIILFVLIDCLVHLLSYTHLQKLWLSVVEYPFITRTTRMPTLLWKNP